VPRDLEDICARANARQDKDPLRAGHELYWMWLAAQVEALAVLTPSQRATFIKQIGEPTLFWKEAISLPPGSPLPRIRYRGLSSPVH
jgi:hypothetical protein